MADRSSFVVENVGPIKMQKIPIPPGGGVVVFKGTKGLGKSTLLNTVSHVVGGDKKAEPSKRDDAPKIRVEGMGATVSINRTARVEGEFVVTAIAGSLVHEIIDPRIEDPIRADAARLKAIVTVAKKTIGPEDFVDTGLSADEIKLAVAGLSADPVKAVAAVKKKIGERALDVEKKLSENKGGYEELARKLREADVIDVSELRDDTVIDAEILGHRDAARDARRDMDWLDESREAYEKAKQPADAHRAVSVIDEELKTIRDRKAELEREISSLKANEQTLVTERAASDAASKVTAGAEEMVAAFERRNAIGHQAIIDEANAAIDRLTKEKATNAESRVRLQDRGRMDALEVEMKTGEETAKKLRKAAADVENVLKKLLPADSPISITDKGRLVVKSDRSDTEPFSELSAGERGRHAIDISVESSGPDTIIVIPQEVWDGIPPEDRSEIAEHAKRRNVVVLTAESTGDPEIVTEVM